MSIPDSAQIIALLDRLNDVPADDLESQYLDFKPWEDAKAALKFACEYAACFANADGGVLVFGVADKVVGKAQAIVGAKGYDPDLLRRQIFNGTRPGIDVEVEEIAVQEALADCWWYVSMLASKSLTAPQQGFINSGLVRTACRSTQLRFSNPRCAPRPLIGAEPQPKVLPFKTSTHFRLSAHAASCGARRLHPASLVCPTSSSCKGWRAFGEAR